jgi:hypothetical protein
MAKATINNPVPVVPPPPTVSLELSVKEAHLIRFLVGNFITGCEVSSARKHSAAIYGALSEFCDRTGFDRMRWLDATEDGAKRIHFKSGTA